MLLPKPYRPIWPLKGYTWSIEITASLEGECAVDLLGDGVMVELPAIRLFGRRLDRYSPAAYWDATTAVVQAILTPWLRSGLLIGKQVSFSTRGRGKARRDTIAIGPVSQK